MACVVTTREFPVASDEDCRAWHERVNVAASLAAIHAIKEHIAGSAATHKRVMMPQAVVEPADAALEEDIVFNFSPEDFWTSVATGPVQRKQNTTGLTIEPRHH